MWILGAIIKIKTLVLVKIVFGGTIPMSPRLNQRRVRYIYIFWFFEARAFCCIGRLILNVFLLVVLKKAFKNIYMMSMTSYTCLTYLQFAALLWEIPIIHNGSELQNEMLYTTKYCQLSLL